METNGSGLFELTNKELRSKNPSDFGEKATIDVYDAKSEKHIYIIYLVKSEKYKNSKTPYGWESTVENAETYKMLDCTPGVELPYYIDEFLHRN